MSDGYGLAYLNLKELPVTEVAPLGALMPTYNPSTDALSLTPSTALGGGGSSAADANIFRPEDFGAKADCIGSGTGVMSGGWFSDIAYTFKEEDVGKEFYTDSTQRIITAVDVNGRCQMSPATGNGSSIHYLMGTDDTAAIQAALDAARDVREDIAETAGATYGLLMRGGVVQLSAGKNYLVSNSQASYNGGKLAALTLYRRICLMGAGTGFSTSCIVLKPGSYGHVMSNVSGGYTDFLTVSNLNIIGYETWNANALDGINLTVAFNGYDQVDPFNRFLDVLVIRCKRNGFHFQGRGELVVDRCVAGGNGQYGFYLTGLNDYKFISCNAAGNMKTGIRILSAAGGSFTNCRSFYSGSNGGSDYKDSCGFYVGADQMRNGIMIFMGCEGQENRGSGWVIDNCGVNHFVACQGQDPARDGLNSGTLPTVCAGWHLLGNGACQNIFTNCFSGPGVGIFNMTNNWGLATDAVYIAGVDGSGNGPQANRGDIYTFVPTIQGGVTDPGTNYRPGYGAKGGAGTSNGKNTLLRVDGIACT